MNLSRIATRVTASAFFRGLLITSLGVLAASAAFAADRAEEEEQARESATKVTVAQAVPGRATNVAPIKLLGTAVVNFTDLAAQEKMFGPIRWTEPRVLTMESEEVQEPAEPGSVNQIEAASPPSFVPLVAGPSPSVTFQGLDDIAMADSNFIIIPPDVAGGVGPDKVMCSFNNNYRVQDKCNGNALLTVGTATFWNPVITDKRLLTSLTDPRTVYDPINNRWIVGMQTVGVGGGASNPNSGIMLLGVSQTSNPAGSWFLYAFGNLAGATVYQLDFPILGYSKNWICETINLYNSAGTFQEGIALVVDYPAARAGTLSSGTVFTGAAGSHFCTAPCQTISATEDSLYLVTHLSSGGATYVVDVITGTSAVPVYTNGATATRTGGGWTQPSGNQLPQSAPNSGASVCGATPCTIESQDAQVRSAPVFRVDATTGRQFIYYTQSIRLPATGATHNAVQWTKVTANITTPAFADGGRIEDATATATNGGKFYAYPHVAVNSIGDMIIGYSQFSSAQHPAAGYSYRDHLDALGTLRDPFIYKTGDDYYHKTFSTNTGRNRWGDFSTAQVDPSDDRSLWVLQEYAKTRTSTNDGTTGANGSKWSTYWANVGGPVPTVSLAPGPTLNEGNAGTTSFTFTVNLSAAYTAPVTVNYQTSDGSATLANNDYVATTGTLTICPTFMSGTITVPVNGDTKLESDETFTLTISAPTNATLGAPTTATGTILNDDSQPSIAINDPTVLEGNAGTTALNFTVSLSNQSDQPITVNYQTGDGSATLANNDYQPGTGTLTLPAKTSSGTVTVLVNGDTKFEGDETVFLNLSGASGATIADNQGMGTIKNDDGLPAISVNDVSLPEGNSGTTAFTFSVSLSNTSDQTVSVNYQTNDGTATLANNDYQPGSGTLTFPPKSSTPQTVTVLVNGDDKYEGNDTFTLDLTGPTGATIADGQGVGTIQNDDGLPTIDIELVELTLESNSGSHTVSIPVTLSTQSDNPTTVHYQTFDGSATVANNDYYPGGGDLTIPPKTSSGTIDVTVFGDTKFEGDETFTVQLTNPVGATLGNATSTVTIQNDDTQPTVSVADASAPEGNGGKYPLMFTLSLSNATDQDVSVTYETADGTATLANNDYQPATGKVVIPAKTTSIDVPVMIEGDTKFEGDETFTLTLTSATNATVADGSATGTILNDDSEPTVSINDVSDAEGNSGKTPFVFTVSLSNATDQDVSVTYQTSDGTATLANNDYQPATGKVVIPAKALSAEVSVYVEGDTKFESNETFGLELTGATNATIADGSGTGTIVDDDTQPAVSIDDVTQPEGNGGKTPFVFTVTLTNTTDQDVSVTYETSDASATLANNDYQQATGKVVIPAKSLSAQITVYGEGDTKFENDEAFTVNLTGATNANVADGTGKATLLNDDTQPVVSISDASGPEGNTGKSFVLFTVSLSNASDQDVSVFYETSDGTATLANDDYQPANGKVVIPAKQLSADIPVYIDGDTKYEGDETFYVNLTYATNASIGDGTGQGTILNDDTQPTVSIDDVSGPEGMFGKGTFMFTVTLSNETDQDVSVTYQTSDGSATLANNDYQPATGKVVIPAKTLTAQIPVLVEGDTKFEGDETFFVNLTGATNASIGDGIGQGTILNDDTQPTVSVFPVSAPEGNSGKSELDFNVVLSNATDQDVSITYQTSDGTATLANNDYQPATGKLTIPAKNVKSFIPVMIEGDTKFEGDETFTLTLTGATNATIDVGTAQGTILNDDTQPTVSISDVSGPEGNSGKSTLTFTVTLSNATDQDVSVTYETADGSATLANNDYQPATGKVVIPAKSLSADIPVLIEGDTKYESDETFFVNLTGATNATVGDGSGKGTIVNDDGVPVLSINDVTNAEGNTGTTAYVFTVSLSNTSGSDVTVHYATANGTATTANNDYVATSGDLTIPAKTLTGQVTVTVNGDFKYESDETFFVNLTSPVGATIGDGQGKGTILNDDVVPSISIADVTKLEGNGFGATTFGFAVSLSNTTDQPVTVQYATANGSATAANNDYVPATGTLTIPAKTASATINITVIADQTQESDENFFVNLTAPTNATIADPQAVGTIQNDDTTPTISINDVSDTEGNSGLKNFTFTVSLSNPSDQPITVKYQTANGSATAPSDYVAVPLTTLTIPPKTILVTVDIKVKGDITNEPNETFFVNLSAPTNATIADAQGQGTIVNDDDTQNPNVTVVTPNGGEIDVIGTTVKLAWTAIDNVGVTSVDLLLSRSGVGGPYETIQLGVPNSGTYTWTVTGPASSHAILEVVAHDAAGNSGSDVSDNEWTIEEPTATLLNRFEADASDEGVTVRWEFADRAGVTGVSLERSEGTSGWSPVTAAGRADGAGMVVVDRDVASNKTYSYRLAGSLNGRAVTFGPVTATTGSLVHEFALSGVSPNPVTQFATVTYAAAKSSHVRLTIVDIQGRVVATLVDGLVSAGRHQAVWNGETSRGVAKAGVYFARYEANGTSSAKRFMLAR